MKLTPLSLTLKTGVSVLVREVTPEDRSLLKAGYSHLSDQSKYFRFLAARHDLTMSELNVFTASNGPDHVAIGALVESVSTSEPVGIARYIRLPHQDNTAEIAVTIADDFQHQGLGSLLLGILAKFAHLNGFSEFNALVHSENRAMLGLLRKLGGVQTRLGGAEIEVRFPVLGGGEDIPQSSVNESYLGAFRLADITQTKTPQPEDTQTPSPETSRSGRKAPAKSSHASVLPHLSKPTADSNKTNRSPTSRQRPSGFTDPDWVHSIWVNEGGSVI